VRAVKEPVKEAIAVFQYNAKPLHVSKILIAGPKIITPVSQDVVIKIILQKSPMNQSSSLIPLALLSSNVTMAHIE